MMATDQLDVVNGQEAASDYSYLKLILECVARVCAVPEAEFTVVISF